MITMNPVLTRELVTTLRTGKSFLLQLLFVGSLTALVLIGWPASEAFDHQDQRRLADALFQMFAEGALVLTAILAPAFTAGSITLEKERRTLDLLLTTPVPAARIVSGKLMASVTYLVLLLISTAPVLSICFLLPGKDPSAIPALYLILVASALTFGMIGLTASTFFDRTQAALSITYLVVIPLVLVMLMVAHQAGSMFFTLGWALTLSLLALILNLALYAACVTRMNKPFDPAPRSIEQEDVSKQAGLVLVRSQFPDSLLVPSRPDELMPDGSNPVREKELRAEILGRGTLFVRLLIQISMILSIPFIVYLYDSAGKEWIFVSYLIAFAVLVGPAFACGAFTLERERSTIDMLRTTLITPRQVLAGKLYASLRFSLILTGFLSISLVIAAVFNTGFGPYRVEIVGYAWIVVLTLAISIVIATAFSLLLQTTLGSMLATYTTLMMLYLAPLVIENILYRFTNMAEGSIVWYTFTSPFRAAMSVNQWGAGGGRGRDLAASALADANLPPVWIAFSLFYLFLGALLLFGLYHGIRRMLRV